MTSHFENGRRRALEKIKNAEQFVIIGRGDVNGEPVTWANDEVVRPSRALSDKLPDSEPRPARAKTPGEFQAIIERWKRITK